MHSRCWPCLNYFLSRLLGTTVNQSTSRNSERVVTSLTLPSYTHSTHQVRRTHFPGTSQGSLLLVERTAYKHKGRSCILSLGLRGRVISWQTLSPWWTNDTDLCSWHWKLELVYTAFFKLSSLNPSWQFGVKHNRSLFRHYLTNKWRNILIHRNPSNHGSQCSEMFCLLSYQRKANYKNIPKTMKQKPKNLVSEVSSSQRVFLKCFRVSDHPSQYSTLFANPWCPKTSCYQSTLFFLTMLYCLKQENDCEHFKRNFSKGWNGNDYLT